ncbi:MAG: hypothetical protein FJ148_06395 [Deltaproteobacteria bacterium]|nr:hypothetical protein [Deltaproteobacteria bacterium]
MSPRRFDASFRNIGRATVGLLLGSLVLAATPAGATSSGATCAKSIGRAIAACVSSVNNATRSCYLSTGDACPTGSGKVATALQRLTNRVLGNCSDAATLAAAGFGPLVTATKLLDRLKAECVGQAATLAARTFGGPKAVLLARATQPERACLEKAHVEATALISQGLAVETPCARATITGDICNVVDVKGQLAIKEVNAATQIATKCSALGSLIGSDIPTYVARTTNQVHCMIANAHGSTGPLGEACGPRPEILLPEPGRKRRITLGTETGARCGNGSRYAFFIRMAPEGQPVDRVVVLLQGGGICTDEASCLTALATNPGAFEARKDRFRKKGILSNDPQQNPFAHWTKVYLPNCGQDVFTGGGATSDFGGATVQRSGAKNLRLALAHARDIIWAARDASDGEGYRPDTMQVVFGGSGSGGYGVVFNLHYLLDELRWAKTVAVVDSSLAPDNGGGNGVASIFPRLLLATDDPDAWNARAMAAPYALPDGLVTGPDLFRAHAARLDPAKGQLLLNVSNQVDDAQVVFGNFASQQSFVIAARSTYCATRSEAALRFFLPAALASTSQFLNTNSFATASSTGVTLASWLSQAASNPTALADIVEEGALGAQLGVPLIACLP